MWGSDLRNSHWKDHLASLMELVAMTSSEMSLDNILNEATSRTRKMMDVDACSIRLVEGEYLSVGAASGYIQIEQRQHKIKIDKMLSECLESCEPIVLVDIESASQIPKTWKKRASVEQFRSYLGVPMVSGGRSIGMLSLYCRTPQTWTNLQVDLAKTVSSNLAVVVENAQLLQNLQESEERYREIAENINDFVFRIDVNGKFIYQNPAIERILAIAPRMRPDRLQDLAVDDDGRETLEKVLTDLSKGDKVEPFIVESKNTNGQQLFLEINPSVIKDTEGTVKTIQGTARDVTEREHAVRSLATLNQELNAVKRITAAVSTHLDLQGVLEQALEYSIGFTGLTWGMFHVINGEGNITRLVMSQNIPQAVMKYFQDKSRGEKFAQKVSTSGFSVVISDFETMPDLLKNERIDIETHGTAISIPLISKDKVVGVMTLGTLTPRTFSPHLLKSLTEFGKPIGVSIENAHLYEEIRNSKNELEILFEATRNLTSLDLEIVMSSVVRHICESVGLSHGLGALVDMDSRELKVISCCGFKEDIAEKIKLEKVKVDDLRKRVLSALTQKFSLVEFDVPCPIVQISETLAGLKIKSSLVLPLVIHDRVCGAVFAGNLNEKCMISTRQIKLAESLANHAAVAIENAKNFDQLQSSNEKYRQLFEESVTALIIVDQTNIVRAVNYRFEELIGYSREEIVSKESLSELFILDDSKSAELSSLYKKKIGPSPIETETTLIAKTGENKDVLIQSAPIKGSTNVLHSVIDITELKKLQYKVFASEHLAKIGQYTAALAHEMRNPLAAMSTSVGVLEQVESLSPEDRELLQIIVDEVDRIKIIFDDFIKYARPAPLRLAGTDINQLVKETVRLMEHQTPENVQLKLSLGIKLPKIRLDINQIRQVLINLILNAFDALPDGGSVQCSTATIFEQDEAKVKISISDTGIGLTPEARSQLFEPFFSTKEKGAGLGLPISKQIIENHSGKIQVDSGDDIGTTFSILLPAR